MAPELQKKVWPRRLLLLAAGLAVFGWMAYLAWEIAPYKWKCLRPVRIFPAPPEEVSSLALSPDGLLSLEVGLDSSVVLRELSSGKVRFTQQHGNPWWVRATCFSPSGQHFLIVGESERADASTLTLREAGTGRLIWNSRLPAKQRLFAAVFTGDGACVVSVSLGAHGGAGSQPPGELTLWDVATGQIIRSAPIPRFGSVMASHSNLPLLLLDTGDGGLVLWDLKTLQPVRTLTKPGSFPQAPPASVVLSATDNTCSAAYGVGCVRVRDLGSGALLKEMRFGLIYPWRWGLSLSPSGRYCAGQEDCDILPWAGHVVRVWDVAAGREICRFHTGDDVSSDAMQFSPDERFLLVGCYDSGKKSLWELPTPVEIAAWQRGKYLLVMAFVAGISGAVIFWFRRRRRRGLTPLPATAGAPGTRAAKPHLSGLAITSLVISILVIPCFAQPILILVALGLGVAALVRIRRSAGRLSGYGLALGGLIAAGFGLLLWLLLL